MSSLYKGGDTMLRFTLASLFGLVIAGALSAPLLHTEEAICIAAPDTENTSISPYTAPQSPQSTPVTGRREVMFPASIPGTDLRAERLVLYEGAMLEDGSDTFLVDAAALELYNCGSSEISLAEVELEFADRKMVFFASNIPAGTRVLVIEEEAALWTPDPCYSCRGWVQYSDDTSIGQDQLEIKSADMGTLTVTNLTNNSFSDLWLFHKSYDCDSQLYIGGITYVTEIPYLTPGQTLLVSPEHYADGYSKIVKIIEVK